MCNENFSVVTLWSLMTGGGRGGFLMVQRACVCFCYGWFTSPATPTQLIAFKIGVLPDTVDKRFGFFVALCLISHDCGGTPSGSGASRCGTFPSLFPVAAMATPRHLLGFLFIHLGAS